MMDSVCFPSSPAVSVSPHGCVRSVSLLCCRDHSSYLKKNKQKEKHGSVVECHVSVCWWTVLSTSAFVCACVSVESELLDFSFPSSSLLVLLFAANMATLATLSLKSLLKAQSLLLPSLKCSQEVSAALAWDQRLPSVSGLWMSLAGAARALVKATLKGRCSPKWAEN